MLIFRSSSDKKKRGELEMVFKNNVTTKSVASKAHY